MDRRRIIPCLDDKDGPLVKRVHFVDWPPDPKAARWSKASR